ncbi:MAG TPA: diguanylate cyclase [Nitrospira sp.]|nr:diguanylate cyclase [Nitrospira sp.]
MPDESPSEPLHLSPDEIKTRLTFLSFSTEDHANLRDIAAVIRLRVNDLIDDFYRHLNQFEELRAILSDPALLARLKQSQRDYLLSFETASFDGAYVDRRFRIGLAHERVGLAQKWYLGAYRLLAELIIRRLAELYGDDAHRLVSLIFTLNKVLRLDETLVVEAYYHTTTRRLEHSFRELTEAHRQLEQLSRLDPLTQIANRRALLETLEKELRRSRRYHRRLALLFLDVDHFKTINDEHGHAFGDRVLQRLTAITGTLIRLADIFGRYGGEEFAIGLVECDEAMAQEVAERIRQTIARTTFEWDKHTAQLTVSIGVTLTTPEVETVDILIEQADRALYRAKARGRNCVELYREPTSA